jgi:hypothetical protein
VITPLPNGGALLVRPEEEYKVEIEVRLRKGEP